MFFIAIDNGNFIVAKNLFTLSEKWRVPKREWDYVSVGVMYNYYLLAHWNGKLFTAWSYLGGRISSHLSATGTVPWRVEFDDVIGTIPTVGDGIVVIGFLSKNKITALSADDGKIPWNFTTDSPVMSSPAYSSGCFYFGASNGVAYAVSSGGKELWHTKLGSIVTTSAAAF